MASETPPPVKSSRMSAQSLAAGQQGQQRELWRTGIHFVESHKPTEGHEKGGLAGRAHSQCSSRGCSCGGSSSRPGGCT